MKANFPKNKWFIAFAIAVLVAVAATVAAIVIGVIANRPPEYTEGDEMGVYYYDAEDGEVLLTLSTGNNFTLSGKVLNMNKTGTYTIEGNNLVFDFFKDQDGTATATLNGTLLELTFEQSKMNFLKKVDYTVSFNVNGGNAVDAVKVTNGKVVDEPAAPTKDNNVFLGWYADDKLTTPFAFATTPIKADTTIYAKWAEKTFGVAEYTVDFDLGYDAAAPESITTISGKAYGVKAPERAGYTFGGWYVSMYADGEKLTYLYTDDTVFTEDTTLYAVWYEDGATKLNAPAVTVSGNRISWAPVSGGNNRYAITVTAPNGTEVVNETVATTAKTFDFAAGAAGEYVISVVALAANEENNSEAAVRYYANKTLDRVTGFQVVNGLLVFNNVKNADKYIITIDCGNDKHNHTAFDNGNRTTFYMANCPMQKGGINVTVIANGEGYAPSTTTFNYDLTLDKIVKVEYVAATDSFIWEAVEGAAEYLVTVKVGDTSYVINNGSATAFSAAGYTGEITVSVVPATPGYNSPDGAEASCTKTKPAKPAGVTVNGMVISWNAAAGAFTYEVKVGNNAPIPVSKDNTSVDLTTMGLELTQGEFYEVQVRAISEANEASDYSDTLKFGYFAMINKLNYNKNTVSWAPVLGVNTYKVRVNGDTEITVTDKSFARVTLTKAGENVIEVKYVAGEDESEWASITVFAYAVEYDTRSAFGSFFTEYVAVGDELMLPGENTIAANTFMKDGYTFTAWATSPMGNAGNGMLLADGAVFTGNGYTVLYGTWTPKTYMLILDISGSRYNISNITNGQEAPATYTMNYTLPVPNTGDPDVMFAGWFTQKNGAGHHMTDGNGNSLIPYNYTRAMTLYPHFYGKEFSFKLNDDGKSYAISAGDGIDEITDVVIPVTYKGLPVTHMEAKSFNNCQNMITIKIPDTMQLIDDAAFRSARNLQSVEVYVADPTSTYETVYSSANGALLKNDMGVVYLERVPVSVNRLSDTGTFVIPSEVTAIKVEAFRYSNVENIVVPANVTELPKNCFFVCTYLKSVTFEERTTPLVLDIESFHSCGNLRTMNLPSNVDIKITRNTASGTEELEFTTFLDLFNSLRAINFATGNSEYSSVNGMLVNAGGDTILYCPKGYQDTPNIPKTVSKIGANAFAGRNQISSVIIPIWVTEIGANAFKDAAGITNVTFEGNRSTKLTVGDGAFRGCKLLQTVNFLANELDDAQRAEITLSANAFFGGAGYVLDTVNIGAGVKLTSIGASAFSQQVNLKNFNIDKSSVLNTIGANAFNGCTALETFTIPATVTSIGQYAFSGCTALYQLSFEEATGDASLSVSTYAFNGCTRIKNVLLPDHLSSFNSAAFEGCTALVSIAVNDTNKLYKSESGILYKRSEAGADDFAELLFYPTGLISEKNGVITNLPATLVKIGGSAFSGKSNLVSITLPATISVIDNSAFKNCENLEEVIFLGSTVTEGAATTLAINTSAFENCASLNKFVLPDYTKSIGTDAFKAAGLVNFVIPKGVTTINSGAFNNCDKLETVTFNNGSELALQASLFSGCTALVTANLGANINAIGTSAFEGCTALETVVIETVDSKLKKIGNKAFYNCLNLETINIPKTVTAIGSQAFAASKDAHGSLTTVNFELGGTSTLYIYKQAFEYQSELKSITFPARVNLYTGSEPTQNKTYDANNNVISNPITTTNFNSKTNLSNGIASMFLGCYSLESVEIAKEEGVSATISYATLDGVIYTNDMKILVFCPAANVGIVKDSVPTYEVVIPNTVTLVMSQAFLDNTKIKTITFEEFDESNSKFATQILYIGHCSSEKATYTVFGGASTSIETINLPSHLHTIRGYAFAVTGENATAMNINFNSAAKNVALSASAFRSCVAQTLALPGIKSMGASTFQDAKLLQSVTMNYTGTTTSLPNYMFQGASALTTFNIPTNIKTIGTSAFQDCTSLTAITLPTGVTTLNQSAFNGCTSLNSVSLPNTVTSIGQNAFTNCTALQQITLPTPSGTTALTISGAAFSGSGLTSITLNSKVTTINNALFKNCKSLTTVTFEGAIKSISQELFFGCENLTTVNFNGGLGSVTKIDSYAFTGCEKITSFPFTSLTSKVTSIGSNVFSHTSIKTVDLTKCTSGSLTLLNNSFNNMPLLEEIKLAPNMSKLQSLYYNLGDYNGYTCYGAPFDNVPNLKKITLSNKFTPAMLACTMSGASALPVFLFDYVLKNCPNIEIVMPSTNTTFKPDSYGVFYDASGTTLLWAPNYVELDLYEIPEGVITIGDYAFAYSNIKKIVIHRDVEVIGKSAFMMANTTEIVVDETLALPSRLEFIDEFAFAGSAIESFVFPSSVLTTDYIAEDSYWGDEFGGYAVGSIYTCNWFSYCPNLKSITLGEGMTGIPCSFAVGVTTLETLNIPNGIKYIGNIFVDVDTYMLTNENYDYAVDLDAITERNTALKNVVIPASVQTMYFSFIGAAGLETVEFVDGTAILCIDTLSFAFCESLQEIELPSRLFKLTGGAFYGASSLKTVDMSKTTIDTVWEHTFEGTTSLESVTFPATLKAIGDFAFYNSGILNIEIPANVEALGISVFENATRLQTVSFHKDNKMTLLGDGNNVNMAVDYIYSMYLPKFMVEGDSNTFKGTTSLETVILPNGMTEIGVSSFENSGVKEIKMADPNAPSALSIIGDKAFAGATRLTYFGFIENPDSEEDRVVHNYLESVTEIGNEAFAGCTALATVEFGRDLVYIGDKAFANCNALEKAYIPASVTTLGGNPYEGVDADKIEVDPTNAAFVLETAADGTVYLKDVVKGEVIGTWAPKTQAPEAAPEA